ncbi:MAG: hypothetical protein FWF53_00165 [Candidatus Azobacteroides sp.]|nr:hypothetical protein [Candidatus Azobacteroides sp.]
MKRHIIFILMTECFFSCGDGLRFAVNSRTVKDVSINFSREYTGLDTLIRIDGYYYHEDGTGLLHEPFIMSNDREFNILYVRYKNHNQIQEDFRNQSDKTGRGKGNYTLSGDTIKVRWAMPFQWAGYNIFSQQYVIESDTTLRQIFHLCETCDTKRDPVRNEIYKFYEYPVDD